MTLGHALQAFSAWIHICAVRLFCESVLRYGVPPKFLAALVKPNQKQVQRLRKLLAAMFSSRGALLLRRCCTAVCLHLQLLDICTWGCSAAGYLQRGKWGRGWCWSR